MPKQATAPNPHTWPANFATLFRQKPFHRSLPELQSGRFLHTFSHSRHGKFTLIMRGSPYASSYAAGCRVLTPLLAVDQNKGGNLEPFTVAIPVHLYPN